MKTLEILYVGAPTYRLVLYLTVYPVGSASSTFNLDLFINDALLLDTLIVVEIALYVILDYLID